MPSVVLRERLGVPAAARPDRLRFQPGNARGRAALFVRNLRAAGQVQADPAHGELEGQDSPRVIPRGLLQLGYAVPTPGNMYVIRVLQFTADSGSVCDISIPRSRYTDEATGEKSGALVEFMETVAAAVT